MQYEMHQSTQPIRGGCRLLAVAVALALSSWALEARADQSNRDIASEQESEHGARPAALDEVVVTARFREESLQDAPAAISALGATQVERAGVRNIDDIATLTPGLTYVSLQGSNYALPVMRGLSTNVGESNVGLFLDGVYQGSRSGMDRMMTDVERIEVIKGPQAALYGRNTFGGAINIISKQPTNQPEGSLSLAYGSRNLSEGIATFSTPVANDQIHMRFGVAQRQRDGHYRNELSGDDLDHRKDQSLSSFFRWYASDNLVMDLRASFDRADHGDNPGYFVLNNSEPLFNGRSQILLGEVPSRTSGFAVTPGGFERDADLFSLKADWQVNDDLSFTSITTYSDLESEFRADIDYGPTDISYQTQNTDVDEISQEFRLAGQGGDISWIGGFFYLRSNQRTLDQDLANAAYEPLLPGSLKSTLIDNREKHQNIALFGSVSWQLADDWTLDLAGRVFREKRSIDPFQSNPITGQVLDPNPPLDMSETFITPSLGLRRRINDQWMGYASLSRGVKSGGFNAMANVTADERTFDAEKSINYEIGAKFNSADNRVTFNTALFHIDWEDQIVRALGAQNATLNANAGKTTSQGAEFDLRVMPLPGLALGASYAYTDATFDDYVFEALRLSFGLESDLAGKELQYVSKHVGTVSFDYQKELSSDTAFYMRGDWGYRSRQYGSTTNLFWVGSRSMVNMAFGFQVRNYDLEFWGRNLLNDKTPTVSISSRDRGSLILPPAGQGAFKTLAFAPELRSYGVRLRVKF